ncbi:MAG TPA: deoxyribodipyrimidine photo-lyase [bacterium]|nr:deoxyribodipyrimidine photo-lyase [bacterium]
MVNPGRVAKLNGVEPSSGPVIYWMSRDQRVKNNWALLFARDIAMERKQPLVVVFTLADSFLGATMRQYVFMLKGLESVEKVLEKLSIPLIVLTGNPAGEILKFTELNKAGALVTDFSPLKIHRHWKEKVADSVKTSFLEVDAHNIVPCRVVSEKQEFAARTMRPKIEKMLPEFLTSFPSLKAHPYPFKGKFPKNPWKDLPGTLSIEKKAGGSPRFLPGEKEAEKTLRRFVSEKLDSYAEERNNPCRNFQSDLSPYLHFGQISAQYAAVEIERTEASIKSKEAFIEELIVRRELADNFCFYNSDYDSLKGFPLWAKKTLDKHRKDPREYLYSTAEFENALTHDKIWNAAQQELLQTGKMHGYMRMYWAKKILEWTASPEEAMELAIYLNDRYSLDGRDPNGYAGIAWSIGGVHDRPWFERPVYGTVRYMSENGIKNKFNIDEYIKKFS